MQNWEDPGEKFHGQTSHIYHYGGHRSVTDGRKLKRNLNNRVGSSIESLYFMPLFEPNTLDGSLNKKI